MYSSIVFVIALMANVITVEQPARNISLEAPYTQIVQILKSGKNPIQNTP